LLLAAMNGFTQAGTAAFPGAPETELAGLLALAENDPATTPASRICIIEDEPLIGAATRSSKARGSAGSALSSTGAPPKSVQARAGAVRFNFRQAFPFPAR
jgi:hypothetical protein